MSIKNIKERFTRWAMQRRAVGHHPMEWDPRFEFLAQASRPSINRDEFLLALSRKVVSSGYYWDPRIGIAVHALLDLIVDGEVTDTKPVAVVDDSAATDSYKETLCEIAVTLGMPITSSNQAIAECVRTLCQDLDERRTRLARVIAEAGGTS